MALTSKNAFRRGVILPVTMTILVSVASGLAIFDKEVRPAYFNLVKTVVICYFRMPGKSSNELK
jgi:hypothetical protein